MCDYGTRSNLSRRSLIAGASTFLTAGMLPHFGVRADDIESVVTAIDLAVKRRFPRVKRIFVEAEDWTRASHS